MVHLRYSKAVKARQSQSHTSAAHEEEMVNHLGLECALRAGRLGDCNVAHKREPLHAAEPNQTRNDVVLASSSIHTSSLRWGECTDRQALP